MVLRYSKFNNPHAKPEKAEAQNGKMQGKLENVLDKIKDLKEKIGNKDGNNFIMKNTLNSYCLFIHYEQNTNIHLSCTAHYIWSTRRVQLG